MIYPTMYRYNAQYRGPKNQKDIGNVVTSVWHDIGVVRKTGNEHETKVNQNITYAMNKSGSCASNLSPIIQLGNEAVTYEGIDTMISKLSSIDVILNNILKNL